MCGWKESSKRHKGAASFAVLSVNGHMHGEIGLATEYALETYSVLYRISRVRIL